MKQATKDFGMSLEAEERIRVAIDPVCEKGMFEKGIKWHPVGGITWEERARRMQAKLREDGDILLTSTGSLGHFPGTIELSWGTARWFADFLKGTGSKDEYPAETKYEAERESNGNVTLTETRQGGFVSDLVFASEEIPGLLAELQMVL
jgi:hypothetical protein